MLYSLRPALAGLVLLAGSTAQAADSGSKADAELAVQGYLAIWANNATVTDTAVSRFYAPHVIYYGKAFSRAEVLADKRAYVRQWPVRHYAEVPGSVTAACNAARTLCHVSAEMTYRRESRTHAVATGRARLRFDFVAVEGGRKIAREAARLL